MSSELIRVDASFISALGNIGKPVATKIKKDFNIKELNLSYPTLSKLAAGKLSGCRNFNFKVRKTSRDKGVLELL